MRFNSPLATFTDILDQNWFMDPRVVFKAAAISAGKIDSAADSWALNGYIRPVIYTDASGNKYRMDLRLFKMPTGASDVTLGTFSWSSNPRTRTFTPSKEGYLISDSGVLIPNPCLAVDVAGALITDYYKTWDASQNDLDTFRVDTLEEGDYFWLQVGGHAELAASGAVNSGDILIASTATAGKVEAAAAIDTSSVANFNTTLKQHLMGDALPDAARGLGVAKETIGGAGLLDVELRLPVRYVW